MHPVATYEYTCPVCQTEQFVKLGDGQMDPDTHCIKCGATIDVVQVRAEHGLPTLPPRQPEIPDSVRQGH